MLSDPFFQEGLKDSFTLVRTQDLFPKIDISDSGSALVVHADLPGVPKENVSVEIHDGNLYIEGETSQERVHDNFKVKERTFGKFSRVVSLPPGIDQTAVRAEFKNGVLELNIPKKVENQPQKITIK
jgi:HSP20 family protein